MLEMLSHSFMQRAVLAGLIVAVICPAIGLFLVLRRQAQYGDALSHVSLAGVAAGLLMEAYPVLTGVAFSVGASLAMDWLRQSYRRYSELSVAIMLSTSVAVAVLLLSLTAASGANVLGYFWGSMMTVGWDELRIIGALGVGVMAVLLLMYKELLSVTFDEEHARIVGLPVRLVNTVMMVLTGITVAMAMSVVGVLLVSSLMVVPVATGLQLARSFRGALTWSVAVGLVSVLVGLAASYQLNLAPGGAVVLSAVAILLVVISYKRIRGLE